MRTDSACATGAALAIRARPPNWAKADSFLRAAPDKGKAPGDLSTVARESELSAPLYGHDRRMVDTASAGLGLTVLRYPSS